MDAGPCCTAVTIENSGEPRRPNTVILKMSDGTHHYYPITEDLSAVLGGVRHYEVGERLITGAGLGALTGDKAD